MFIDISLMNSDFSASVAEIIPTEYRDAFLEENAQQSSQMALSFLNEVNNNVPDLSEKQSSQLADFVRSTGTVVIELDDIKEILREEQTSTWIAGEERSSQSNSTDSVEIPGPDGETTEVTIKRRRESTNGNLPAYFWEDPLTLDEVEAEARILAQSNGITKTTTIVGEPK